MVLGKLPSEEFEVTAKEGTPRGFVISHLLFNVVIIVPSTP